ncbi:MAG: HlyD family secretion protein [Rhizobiaceae bacterium]
MFELLFTSFPVIIQYFILRRRGESMTVWNMKTAVFIWLFLAFLLFLTIFYYHPKSYTGLVPFRTVSVVAQTSGPVTQVAVINGQRVEEGDLLFQIENSTQKAALTQAETAFESLDASEAKAKDAVKAAEANVAQAQVSLAQITEDLANAEVLLSKKVTTEDAVRKLRSSAKQAEAILAAAQAQLGLSRTELTDVIPAARKSADAELNSAKVELAKTEVRAFSSGIVSQLALTVGSPASRLILSPAMVIIPDRIKGVPVRIVAGFSQVAKDILHVGMPAEIACDSNSNLAMKNAVMAARITGIQPAVAAGQITPGGNLIELNSRIQRGSILVFFDLVHKEHEPMLLDGSGCIVQTYTNNLEGTVGHVIGATGIVKAFLLRTKAWGVLVTGVGLGGGGH